MGLIRRTVVDEVVVSRDGVLQVRLQKQIFDEATGKVESYVPHPAMLEVEASADELRATLNTHLELIGDEPIAADEFERVKDVAEKVWTPAVVNAFRAAKAARLAAEQPPPE